MSLVNNSANNFKDFLDAIKPFLNYQFYDMSGQGVEANNFSTDEKVIGTWIDGKPLYQKTFNITTIQLGSNQWTTISSINCNELGVDKIVNSRFLDISQSASTNRDYIGASYNINTSEYLRAYNVSAYSVDVNTCILQYTKTTDTAVASGEKIVGQWIDGKPVYQKVFEKTLSNVNYDTNYDFDISGLSIDGIAKIDVLSSYSDLWEFESACWMQSNSVLRARQKWTNNGGTVTVRIILQYTKTT